MTRRSQLYCVGNMKAATATSSPDGPGTLNAPALASAAYPHQGGLAAGGARRLMAGADDTKQGAPALADLFETEYERLVRYFYARIGNGAMSEELASDVFVRALERIDTYEWRGIPIQAWLFRIAHNMLVDHLRKVGGRRSVPIEAAEHVAAADNPEDTALLAIEREELLEAMESLTEAQREAISLRFFGGLTSEETAQVMKRSNGAVRELQSSGLKNLRRILSNRWQEKAAGDERG
ncbi:MAG: sigma-70 family RNA polymerase sigma factor [Chloroflexi bacterium]|nr:sigma-70 family RNA polymerase sigma factor [Chloroflexota bacterium]